MGICASKNAIPVVETKEGNVDSNGAELKESNPNEPLLVEVYPTNLIETIDGDGAEEAGHTEKVSTVRAPKRFSSHRFRYRHFGSFSSNSSWIC